MAAAAGRPVREAAAGKTADPPREHQQHWEAKRGRKSVARARLGSGRRGHLPQLAEKGPHAQQRDRRAGGVVGRRQDLQRHALYGRDETCPVSTGGGTRRVQSVGGERGQRHALPPPPRPSATAVSAALAPPPASEIVFG